MLNGNGPTSGEVNMGQVKIAERCKPDYEMMISKIQARLDRSEKFRDAILEYFKGQTVKNKMAELVGEIVTECIRLAEERDSLVKAQEEDQE